MKGFQVTALCARQRIVPDRIDSIDRHHTHVSKTSRELRRMSPHFVHIEVPSSSCESNPRNEHSSAGKHSSVWCDLDACKEHRWQAVPIRDRLFTRNYWNCRNNLCRVATGRQTSQCCRQRTTGNLPEIELRDNRVGRLADSSVCSIQLQFRVHARSFRHSPWTSPRRIEWPAWREASIGRLCYLNFSRLSKQFA